MRKKKNQKINKIREFAYSVDVFLFFIQKKLAHVYRLEGWEVG